MEMSIPKLIVPWDIYWAAGVLPTEEVAQGLTSISWHAGCAGIVRTADFLDMSDKAFDAVLDINLKGVFIVSPYNLPL